MLKKKYHVAYFIWQYSFNILRSTSRDFAMVEPLFQPDKLILRDYLHTKQSMLLKTIPNITLKVVLMPIYLIYKGMLPYKCPILNEWPIKYIQAINNIKFIWMCI